MEFIIDGKGSRGVIVFAHGSSIAMDHQYMQDITEKLVAIGLKVVRFEFPYMASRRMTGKKAFPNKLPILINAFQEVIAQVRATILKPSQPLYLAGKSLGGRVASHLYIEAGFDGLFVFGYPFHPAKDNTLLRTEHLLEVTADMHIFQGERDKLGNKEEVMGYQLNKNIQLHWLADGDHDLVPRVRSGFSKGQHINDVIKQIEQVLL